MTTMALVKLILLVFSCLCADGLQRNERGEEGRVEEFSGEIPVIPPIPTDDDDDRPMSKRGANSDGDIVERPGHPSETHACTTVTTVPEELRKPEMMYPHGLDVFYQKYTHAYRIPIIGSVNVTDSALRRACYMVRFLLADRPDVREMFYKRFNRFGLMAYNEMTTDMPEFRNHTPRDWWDARARGLGPQLTRPVTTGGEENTVCLNPDRYFAEDIPLHELSHAVAQMGARYAISDFDKRLNALYAAAKAKGERKGTYAMTHSSEYWAEGVQSYFNVNSHTEKVPNRTVLAERDIGIIKLIKEIWPCKNKYLPRCYSSRELEAAQRLRMNCKGTKNQILAYREDCLDKKYLCAAWANDGLCKNLKFARVMKRSCPKSCRLCELEKYTGKANVGRKAVGKPILKCDDVATDCGNITCTDNITYAIKQCRKTCTQCASYLRRDYGTFRADRAVDETQCKLGEGRTRCWWPKEFRNRRRCTENGRRVRLNVMAGMYNCVCNYRSTPMYEDCIKLSA